MCTIMVNRTSYNNGNFFLVYAVLFDVFRIKRVPDNLSHYYSCHIVLQMYYKVKQHLLILFMDSGIFTELYLIKNTPIETITALNNLIPSFFLSPNKKTARSTVNTISDLNSGAICDAFAPRLKAK